MALPPRRIPPISSEQTIVLSPQQPRILSAAPDGSGAWQTSIRTRGLTTVEWRILDPSSTPRGDWITLSDPLLSSASGVALTVPFLASGDLIRVRAPGDDDVYAQSSRVRLLPPDPLEPAVPAGWVVDFFDRFNAFTLDRGNWRIISGGPGFDATLVKIRNGGLVLQAVRGSDGVYRTSGIQAGRSDVRGPSWGDFQISVRCRFERGKGLGAKVSLVPYQANATLPKLDLIQTPDASRATLGVAKYWTGNAAGSQAIYPVDLTDWHVVTARRVAGRWNLWLDGAEQVVPTAWAANNYTTPLTVSLGTVAAGTHPTKPRQFRAFFDHIKIYAPA